MLEPGKKTFNYVSSKGMVLLPFMGKAMVSFDLWKKQSGF